MRFIPLGFSVALLASAQPALAGCNTTATDRRCLDVLITRVVTSEDGLDSIQISEGADSLSCTAASGYLNIDMSKPYSASLYAHILSLYLLKKRTNIRLSDSISACTITYIYSDN